MAQGLLEKVFLIFRKKLGVFFHCSWIMMCLHVMTGTVAAIFETIKL